MIELMTVGAVLILLLIWVLRRLERQGDQSWLPRELRRSTLVYAEKLFRAPGLITLTAKVDRGYRDPAGIIVLVELKNRQHDCVLRSDVIELSAQRVAVMVETGGLARVCDRARTIGPPRCSSSPIARCCRGESVDPKEGSDSDRKSTPPMFALSSFVQWVRFPATVHGTAVVYRALRRLSCELLLLSWAVCSWCLSLQHWSY